MITMGKLPQTPNAKKVIEYATEEAKSLNHNHIGTEHLLLGLLREQDGIAAQVLMDFGLKLEDARERVRQLDRTTSSIPRAELVSDKDRIASYGTHGGEVHLTFHGPNPLEGTGCAIHMTPDVARALSASLDQAANRAEELSAKNCP